MPSRFKSEGQGIFRKAIASFFLRLFVKHNFARQHSGICKCHLLTALNFSFSRLMQWVQSLVTGVSVLRDLSLSLSCPAHCGGSSVLSFVAGLCCGLSCGLLCGLYILWISSLRAPPAHNPPSPAPSRPRRSRLSTYLLDEQ